MKTGIFFCDIVGTLTNGTDEDYKIFASKLSEIKKCDNLNGLFFSLASTNGINDVLKFYKKLKPFLDKENIELGPLLSSDGIFGKNKTTKIIGYKVDQILSIIDNSIFTHVYYADDTMLYHYIMNAKLKNKNIYYQSFILGNIDHKLTDFCTIDYEIDALNCILDDYIVEKKTNKIKRFSQ